jgi:dTDP-4-amino-4,6-dideoxygalactose transaminase
MPKKVITINKIYVHKMIKKENIKYLNPMFGITQEEVDAVIEVLRTPKYPLYGDQIENFEKEFAKYVGVEHAVAVSSGTAGLHLSYIACDFKPRDEIITPSHSFYSVTDCMLFEGIKPVFCDIDYDTFTMDPEDVESKISDKTKAIVPVHLNGHPVDMSPILDIADDKNLIIIENSAHALGAKYRGQMVGTLGDLSMFSFAPGKHITTMGDGGMVTTNNEELAEKIRLLHNHGRGPIFRKRDERGFPMGLGNDLIGYNYRMNEINAAIGRVQLKRFKSGITGPNIRRQNAREYKELLEDTPIEAPIEKKWAYHSFCRFVTKTIKRDDLWVFLKKKGIRCGIPYYPPIHLNRTYLNKFGFKKGIFPVTEKVTEKIISFPLRRIEDALLQKETEQITDAIKLFFN